MKRITQSPLSEAAKALRSATYSQRRTNFPQWTLAQRCCLHTSTPQSATVAPITGSGPPPRAPVPVPSGTLAHSGAPVSSAQNADARVARKRKQAELLKRGRDMRDVEKGKGGGSAATKRFWRFVDVLDTPEGLQVLLDHRPLRRPNKKLLLIPHTKPHLALAIALEWDLLISSQQATRQHLIPLTSLLSRALDIEDEGPSGEIRAGITKTVMRYLDTDSLLCWAPEPRDENLTPGYERHVLRTESLRSIQIRTAEPVIRHLTTRVWPGLEIVPVLDGDSIFPREQPQITRDVIQGWIEGLPAFELAGLERGVLAGKGLLGAVRLLVEWSAELEHLRGDGVDGVDGGKGEGIWGVEEASRAASLEVDWQTGMWGEVEDTHDVEKEDVRRQMGSVVLLVSGVGTKGGK